MVEPLAIIASTQLVAGDVVACYSKQMLSESGCETGYSHVGIFLGEEKILESDSTGVKYTSVGELLEAYDHLAILRATETWDSARLKALALFAQNQIGKKFNIRALPRIQYLREQNIDTSLEQIEAYFAGQSQPVETDRKSYFCSELVVSAFIQVGIITQSAAILFKPETLLPIDIIRDKLFGFFVGYIPKCLSYEIPGEDIFRREI